MSGQLEDDYRLVAASEDHQDLKKPVPAICDSERAVIANVPCQKTHSKAELEVKAQLTETKVAMPHNVGLDPWLLLDISKDIAQDIVLAS